MAVFDGTLDSNSYISGDGTNALKWSTLEDEQYAAVNEYYKGLIAFRKAHGALRLTTAEDVAKDPNYMQITEKALDATNSQD